MKQYACLNCGFIHSGNMIEKIRKDKETEAHTARHVGTIPAYSFHGFIEFRICPECGYKIEIGQEQDKK